MTLAFDHVHLSAPDPAQAGAWYIRHLGAREGASPERVLIGERMWLIFYKAARTTPSRDSVIDSIGFSAPDPAATMQAIAAAGGRIVSPLSDLPGLGRSAIVEDPYGARVTLVARRDQAEIAFHHVHLNVPDPEATLDWYQEMFGGTRAQMNASIDGIQYGPMWLLAGTGHGTPSEGHAIDHVGWRTPQLDRTAAMLKSRAGVFTMEPRQFNPTVRISFIDGPVGTRIEIVERQ